MRASNLQLVLPLGLHETCEETQQEWLMNLVEFISLVNDKQSTSFKIAK